jgi:hypothetical protein
LFGSAPLTERVAAAAAADAAFLGAFGSSHPNGQQQHEWLASTGHGREELDDDDDEGEEGDEIEDDDDDEDYEDEEEDDDDGREFSFPIDLAALAKSAGMPFPASASGSASGSGQQKGGGGASTYEDIVNRLAQAQQQVQQQSGGDRGFTPAQLLQLQSAGAMIESDAGGGGGGGGGGEQQLGPVANGILSDSTDPLSLGPASLPSLMAAISELEQCVARLSLEASEARSLQRRMRDELGAPPSAGGDLAYGAGEGGGAGGEERLRAALEKKKMRNKKKKDKKKAKAAAAAVAAEEAALSQQQQLAATEMGDAVHASGGNGPESASSEENGDAGAAAAAADGADHSDHSLSTSHGQGPMAAAGEPASHHKKEDGELIKALQSVSMLDRRADEYRERLRVLKVSSCSFPRVLCVDFFADSDQRVHAGANPPPCRFGGRARRFVLCAVFVFGRSCARRRSLWISPPPAAPPPERHQYLEWTDARIPERGCGRECDCPAVLRWRAGSRGTHWRV